MSGQEQQEVIRDMNGVTDYRILEDGSVEIVNRVLARGLFGDYISLNDFSIPETVDDRVVTKIGNHAFANLGIRSVWIPDCITSIDGNPFAGNKIYYIRVSDDNPYFATIDNVLFSKPDKRLITFPGGALTKDLKPMKDYEIPKGIRIIGEDAFESMEHGSSITIPSTVDTILTNPAAGDFSIEVKLSSENENLKMVNNCLMNISDGRLIMGRPSNYPVGLKSYELTRQEKEKLACRIPDSVKVIGKKAFCCSGSDCYRISIPQSVNVIEDEAFKYCFRIKSITIPNSVTSIGKGAFHGCEQLGSVTLPTSISVIRSDTFKKCQKLESIKIPNGVTTIEKGAFSECLALKSITIPRSVKKIEHGAFQYEFQLTMRVAKGSYAHKYCEEHGIDCEYPGRSEPDKNSWLNS